MHRTVISLTVLLTLSILLITGCATQDVRQFDPLPRGEVGTVELRPVDTRPVVALLREAESAFKAANEAQEQGDNEAALRHYTLMLELLIEADLDPSVFYSLRGEFETVLDTSTRQAGVQQRRRHYRYSGADYAGLGEYSEIPVPFPLPERVLHEIERIQNRYPKNFQAGLDRAQLYLPYIQAELRKAGLPEELAWVAMIESLFTPKIVSRAGAGGMWQFMRATGHRYKLRIDNYVDERYNWQSATHAAIGYLRDLHRYFDGDWSLAVTAYNMGEGGLERAIASNGGERDLWTLIETPPASNRIRLETKEYYPKFLATLIVASSPERYGFRVNPVPPEQNERVRVDGMYALADLNRALGLSGGTLESLNPDLVREVTPPDGNYTVAVPSGQGPTLLAALEKVRSVREAGGGTHTVRRGETVSAIAARYRVSQQDLMALNNIRSARHLQTGQRLRIPGMAGPVEEAPARAVGGPPSEAPVILASASSTVPPVASAAARTYRVRTGDTLYEIARRHKVSVGELQAWNNMGRSSRITVGRTLNVSDPARPAPAAPAVQEGGGRYHTVHAGEYPARIAKMYGLELASFLEMNGLSEDDTIRVGDKLLVASNNPASVYSAPGGASEAEKVTHTVCQGDTASAIAARYGVPTRELLAWNNLGSRSVLRIGDKLVVYTGTGSGPAAQSATEDDGLEKIVHTVAGGHNPTTIARRYGVKVDDLFRWNNWPKNKVLHVGEEVIVYRKR